ncbi:hypothetical protein RBSH_02400 [Rhodopirellula baltica SH28]|uniref:Uncharacterized protein n=1 Tax=Rhodopirellula baltica SH28 TaxID=993517 RepID=K5E924_RHOBT|nr:hypothetical protein RBSH_02400 [Rhodopirellula baltica SH28]
MPVNVPLRWHMNHASLCSKASAWMPCVTWPTSGDRNLQNGYMQICTLQFTFRNKIA